MTLLNQMVSWSLVRKKILHNLQLYVDNPDPVVFLTIVVNDSVRYISCLVHHKGSVGLILVNPHRPMTECTRCSDPPVLVLTLSVIKITCLDLPVNLPLYFPTHPP